MANKTLGPSTMKQKGEHKSLDLLFGRFMARLSGDTSPDIRVAAELVSQATRAGHGCIDLRDWAGHEFAGADGSGCVVPFFEEWREKIASSSVVGSGAGQATPLVLENERLYLRRYWEYEEAVASFLLHKGSMDALQGGGAGDQLEVLRRLFPEDNKMFRWHRLAALAALRRSFVVVTGGPGTGKTTTIARIMALLVECSGKNSFRIALAAPTGKAVMRLQKSVAGSLGHLDCRDQVLERIPTRATTIHRLLGTIKDSPYFRHNDEHKLPYDLVIIDEASMVDLPLMAKLVRALSQKCRLIILGDRDQLSSVEPGAVLGDICCRSVVNSFSRQFISEAEFLVSTDGLDVAAGMKGCLADSLVELHAGFRFTEESGIGKLARAVKIGDGDEVMRLASDAVCNDVTWRNISESSEIEQLLRKPQGAGMGYGSGNVDDPEKLLSESGKFQILCALRNGPYGVVELNRIMEKYTAGHNNHPGEMIYHEGLPLIINRNDYQLDLFNGDTGIVARDAACGGNLRAFFPAAGGQPRSFSLGCLPPHESCYAMTVHKSQGSEFDWVILVLPDRQSPVLTRELIYTAVSRARKKIEIWGKEDVLKEALASGTHRRGGLREKLWGSSF